MKSFLALMAEEKRTPPSPGRNAEIDRLIGEVRSLHDMMESSAAARETVPSPAEEPAAGKPTAPLPVAAAAEPPAPSPALAPEEEPAEAKSLVAPPEEAATEAPARAEAAAESPAPSPSDEAAITLAPEPPCEDDWLVRRLLEQGVEHGACGRIRTAVAGRLAPALRPAAEEIRREAGAVIESAVRAAGVPPPGNRGPRILVFVGPSGAGKTVAAVRAGRLLSRRGFRCAAVSAGDDPPAHTGLASSLERELGIPTLSARDDEELSRAVARCGGAQYLLVDVSGRTCGDRQALRKLAKAIGRRAEIDFCLTLPAGWGGTRAERIVEKLKPLPVGFLTFTKLDETDRYGEMYNAAASAGVPVLFLTAGRSLPGRILTAHPRMFSRLLLDKFPPTENVP